MKVKIEHSNSNATQFGYGLYINGITAFPSPYPNEILASECLRRNATDVEIKRAEVRVRAKALREFNKLGGLNKGG